MLVVLRFHQTSPAFRGYYFVRKHITCCSTIFAYITLVHLGMRSVALYLETLLWYCLIDMSPVLAVINIYTVECL